MLNIVNMSNIEYLYYYKNENNDKFSPFNGILYSKNNKGKIISEIEIVNGLKHGSLISIIQMDIFIIK